MKFPRKVNRYCPHCIFHKNAKINKKTLPLFECSECGKQRYGKAFRVKKFELQAS
ncbi:MAG: hypothetical protein P8Y97_08785 [Candidatus Lokiarchaeota archaeon]